MTHFARFLPLVMLLLGTVAVSDSFALEKAKRNRAILVIHGGAGTISRDQMTPEKEKLYRDGLSEALATGYKILNSGGSSMDAVEAAICVLEDNPLFNAGRGSVFTSNGHNEMDASIMDGKTHNAGAVASVTGIKNPIKAARAVMEKTSHVMLVGTGAEEVDRAGNLAAATSTGGLTNKRWGRVGDAPIIGAGTYADNETCAVSCTGRGEVFIQGSIAHEMSVLMKYRGLSVDAAAKHCVSDELVTLGGKDTGGLIAMDRKGNFAMQMNTAGMYR